MDTEAIAAFDLLSRMRFACGDNGKRMQDELEEYLRGLKRDAERYRWLCDGSKQDEMGVWIVKDGAVTHYLSDEEVDEAIDAAMNGANDQVQP